MKFPPKLNVHQLLRLSEIAGNLGLLFFGVIVLPFFTRKEGINIYQMLMGWLLTFISWSASIILLKGVKK